jgi:hypothetical protein
MGSRQVPMSRELSSSRMISWKMHRRSSSASSPVAKCACAMPSSSAVTRSSRMLGRVIELHCSFDETSRSGQPGADRKVKGTIHWVSAEHAIRAEVRLYDRLFKVPTRAATRTSISLSISTRIHLKSSTTPTWKPPSAISSPAIRSSSNALATSPRISTAAPSDRYSTAPSPCASAWPTWANF